MTPVSHKKQLEEAKEKLLELEQQKLAIEQQMRGWIKIIEGFQTLMQEALLDDDNPPTREEVGLTERVRDFLRAANATVGALQIRDQLLAEGVDPSTSKNLLINIHTILRRLCRGGEVVEVPLPDGTKVYKYMTLLQRILRGDITTENPEGVFVGRARTLDAKRKGALLKDMK
jgi:hypothetical protein